MTELRAFVSICEDLRVFFFHERCSSPHHMCGICHSENCDCNFVHTDITQHPCLSGNTPRSLPAVLRMKARRTANFFPGFHTRLFA